jgi:ZIP family zinc transporter
MNRVPCNAYKKLYDEHAPHNALLRYIYFFRVCIASYFIMLARNLRFYSLALVCLLFVSASCVYAHGGIDHSNEGVASGHGVIATGNVGLAFGMTSLAAVACIIGSLLPFVDLVMHRFGHKDFSIVQNKPFLASSIGFAAGVLIYLCLGDLYPEATRDISSSLEEHGTELQKAAGIISVAILTATMLIIYGFKRLFRRNRSPKNLPDMGESGGETVTINTNSTTPNSIDDHHFGQIHRPINRAEFRRLSLQIAFALLIHNFPEGLATFAMTLRSAQVGTMFGIGLALHKLPEGVMISLPIYIATGSRLKGFLISAIIGAISQFLGALCGYLLFITYWNSAISGAMFLIAISMLLYTVFMSMLPLARSFDIENHYVGPWLLGGILFFALVSSFFWFT